MPIRKRPHRQQRDLTLVEPMTAITVIGVVADTRFSTQQGQRHARAGRREAAAMHTGLKATG